MIWTCLSPLGGKGDGLAPVTCNGASILALIWGKLWQRPSTRRSGDGVMILSASGAYGRAWKMGMGGRMRGVVLNTHDWNCINSSLGYGEETWATRAHESGYDALTVDRRLRFVSGLFVHIAREHGRAREAAGDVRAAERQQRTAVSPSSVDYEIPRHLPQGRNVS